MTAPAGHSDPVPRQKHQFLSIAERNRTIERIIGLICEKRTFLLLGHELPDEDCVASLVSMALLIRKFGKEPRIFIRDHIQEQLTYLLDICTYNHIKLDRSGENLTNKPDAIFILDTPKPDMIASSPVYLPFLNDPDIIKVEIDHHFSGDAAYSGTELWCLVSRASSTCELICHLCWKIADRPELLKKYRIDDLFTRNIVLSLLTGMIGDSKFGLNTRKHRDAAFYQLFTNRLGTILRQKQHKNSMNFSSIKEIFSSIQSLSLEERELYELLSQKAHLYGKTGHVVLGEEESALLLGEYEYSSFVNVIKTLTDDLSNRSGAYGLTVYYDPPVVSNLLQFRIRSTHGMENVDLRIILHDLEITDGGGHPGAIGFRIPRDHVSDLDAYITHLLNRLNGL